MMTASQSDITIQIMTTNKHVNMTTNDHVTLAQQWADSSCFILSIIMNIAAYMYILMYIISQCHYKALLHIKSSFLMDE